MGRRRRSGSSCMDRATWRDWTVAWSFAPIRWTVRGTSSPPISPPSSSPRPRCRGCSRPRPRGRIAICDRGSAWWWSRGAPASAWRLPAGQTTLALSVDNTAAELPDLADAWMTAHVQVAWSPDPASSVPLDAQRAAALAAPGASLARLHVLPEIAPQHRLRRVHRAHLRCWSQDRPRHAADPRGPRRLPAGLVRAHGQWPAEYRAHATAGVLSLGIHHQSGRRRFQLDGRTAAASARPTGQPDRRPPNGRQRTRVQRAQRADAPARGRPASAHLQPHGLAHDRAGHLPDGVARPCSIAPPVQMARRSSLLPSTAAGTPTWPRCPPRGRLPG